MSPAHNDAGATLLHTIWQDGEGTLEQLILRTGLPRIRVLPWLGVLALQGLITVLGENRDAQYGPALDAEQRARQRYAELSGQPSCRVCGCTEDWACPEGCAWVEPGLCSTCLEDEDD